MKKESPCLQSIEQLCDVLEMHLGHEAGSEACRQVMEHVRDCPTCCAEVDTLGKTIKIFREIPTQNVPKDIQWKLMTTLNLELPPELQEKQK
ncbi:hypothetical protein K8I28_08880 [bacterium]|nr:hypothetical protein [bacterium]